MCSQRLTVYMAAILLLTAGCAQQHGASAPSPSSDAQQAASNALATLRKLVTEKNYKDLGFTSPDEVKGASLARPLMQYNIGLERLKSYQPDQDPNSLLTPSAETIYPVTVGDQVRSSVTVVKKESGYTTASFGNAAIIKSLSRYRKTNAPDGFVVRIPALGMYFFGSRSDSQLILVPVVEDNRLPFRIGEPVPADSVLKAIVPLAQAYNGLPI